MAVQLFVSSVRPLTVVLLTLSVSCLGVSKNQSGRIMARGTGVVSESPVDRIPFDAEVRDACGHGGIDDEGPLVRRPYLQRVTTTTARVVWTASRPGAMGIRLTHPDGTLIDEVGSSIDGSVPTHHALQHVAHLEGLEPDTLYCYQVVGAEASMMDRTGFRTAPSAGGPVTFVAFGDMGSGNEDQRAVMDQVRQVPFDLVLTVGDNAYQDGTHAEFERNFFDVYAPILQSAPVYPSLGNHDYRTDDAAPYLSAFVLPENGGPGGTERWYSFDRGDVHFVALDSERLGSAQLAWLEADLAANDQPWTIVYMHEPPFSSGDHGGNSDVREMLCPLFEAYGVDLVMSGHDHHYERTVSIDGPVYLVTGGGGIGTRPAGRSSFTAYAEDVLHFLWVRVEGDTLDLRAIDATGAEFDSVVLRRGADAKAM